MAECSSKDCKIYESNDLSDDFNDFCHNFTFLDTSSCCQCNGFNGPNSDHPVCTTCHKFLFSMRFSVGRKKRLRDDFVEVSNLHKYLRYNDSSRHVSQPRARSSSKKQLRLKDLNKIFHEFLQTQNNNNMKTMNEPVASSSKVCPYYDFDSSLFVSIKIVKSNTKISALPVEILLKIFSFLDDTSLIDASKVSRQWKQILESQQELWRTFTKKRWPLFRRKVEITNWYQMYSSLLSSCFCSICAVQMMHKSEHDREYLNLHKRAENDGMAHFRVNGIKAIPISGKLAHWQASIVGPADSPYEGGIFYLYIYLPFNYPFDPPIVKFLTKIIHPNISRHGDIGLDIITWNYCSSLTIHPMLLSIQSLFCDPYTKVCMEPELGRLYENDRARFNALARHWTKKYAMMEVADLTT